MWLSILISHPWPASCDGNHLVDVVNRASAAEVVDRTGDTLEDRTDGICISKPLNELVSDVSDLKAREYKHIRVTGNLGARCLLLSYRRNECSISLKLTFNLD